MLQIYNTLTKQKEAFQPISPEHIKLYVCGMTVYDYCHIGHGRVFITFDMIVRYLRARGYRVTHVCNITDIDDKIIKRAKENEEDISTLKKESETEKPKNTMKMVCKRSPDFIRMTSSKGN